MDAWSISIALSFTVWKYPPPPRLTSLMPTGLEVMKMLTTQFQFQVDSYKMAPTRSPFPFTNLILAAVISAWT